MARLKDKVAVITGGTTGIGLATAKAFASEGAKVVITGRNEQTLKAAQSQLNSGTVVLKSDTSKQAEIGKLAQDVKERVGKVDILFVNAGIAKFAPIEQSNEQFFDEQFAVNVKGAYFTIQSFLPLLKQGSSIILNASVAASKGVENASVYSATKAALRSFGRTLATELAPRGIRVNTISPGPIETPIFDKLGMSTEEVKGVQSGFTQTIAMKRMGKPEEVAAAALFLGSDDSSFMTGTELLVDGGFAAL
jgi:NAD(P)-dependent dehydrogenase (short-subunit alcohol dehydrogenase family)